MSRRTILRIIGVGLIAAALIAYAVSGNKAPAVELSLRTYEQAAGHPEAQAKASGPRTRQWIDEMRQAALTERRAELQNRTAFETITILDWRSRYSAKQLSVITTDQALTDFLQKPGAAKDPIVIQHLRIQGDQATARLMATHTTKSGRNSLVMLGEGSFFSRENGAWFFEPALLYEAIMTNVTSGMGPKERTTMIEQALQETYSSFQSSLWDGPRQ